MISQTNILQIAGSQGLDILEESSQIIFIFFHITTKDVGILKCYLCPHTHFFIERLGLSKRMVHSELPASSILLIP